MTVRNIKKNLAGAEDLLHGIGIESQSRGGAVYEMHKLDTYVPTYDIAEMQKSTLTFMRLYGDDTHYTDYRRNPAGTVGIPSDLGGVWEPIKTSELQVVGNSLYGAYVYDVDQVMCHNSTRYSWSGAFPKVVAAGSTPETSGGVGAGAWRPVGDIALREELATAGNANLVDDSNIKVQVTSSGSVPRSQHSKNDDAVSVKDYGAVGDGTTDDTAAVAAALAAGVKHFPRGDYLVSTPEALIPGTTGEGLIKYLGVLYPAGDITTFISLPVPAVFPSIMSALDWLQYKRIKKTLVQIKVSDGEYTSPQITHQHPDGCLIQIIGNISDHTKVVLKFDSSNFNSGIHMSNGNVLALIDGFTITTTNGWLSHGNWDAAIKPYGAGILASYGGAVTVGSAMHITKFYYGVKASYGASINCNDGVMVSEAGDVGFHAFHGGSVNAVKCTAFGTWDALYNIGAGFMAEQNGSIHAENSISHDNYMFGFAGIGGSIWAQGALAYKNNYGFMAQLSGYINGSSPSNLTGDPTTSRNNNVNVAAFFGGTLEFFESVSSASAGDGIVANGGSINCNHATSKNNVSCGYVARNNGVIFGSYTSTGNGVADIAENGGRLAATMS